jgi:hypothetical protein
MIRTEPRRTPFFLISLCVAAGALGGGCGPRDAQAAVNPPPSSALTKHEPTAERLIERSRARWKLVADKNWIEAYDFNAPEVKKMVALAQYLPGKSSHEYANPKVEEVLRIQNDQGYARVGAAWTPHHPEIAKVKLEPGQSLTQDIEMIETWHFVDGDWWFVRAQDEEEFFHAHADLLKTPGPANAPVPSK